MDGNMLTTFGVRFGDRFVRSLRYSQIYNAKTTWYRCLFPSLKSQTLISNTKIQTRSFRTKTILLKEIEEPKEEKEKRVEKWTVEEVAEWASNIDGVLKEDAELLRKQRISGKALIHHTKDDFRNIGIPSGPATILEEEIKKLKAPQDQIKASSLEQLIERLMQNKKLKETGIQTEDKFIFDYKEPKEAFNGLRFITAKLYESFKSDSSQRADHSFPLLATGSGMGKTRFGFEARRVVEDILGKQGCKVERIFIDFNGTGDRLVGNRDIEPVDSMGVRLLARGLFGVSVDQLRDFLLPEEEYLCKPRLVLSEIADKYRLTGSTLPTCILIHIDEFQLAHEACISDGKPNFVKHMLYTLGDYRISEHNRPSNAKKDNLFIIPLLTGTSRQGADFALTQYKLFYIPINPLSVDKAVEILKKEHDNSPIFDQNEWKSLLCDIGVVPRYLEWLSKDISRTPHLWRNEKENPSFVVKFYGNLLLEQDYKIRALIEKLGGPKAMETHSFLLYILTGHQVQWDTTFNGNSIEKLAQIGNIFLHIISGSKYRLYLPTFLLHVFALEIENQLLSDLTEFPLDWKRFETFALGMVVVRVNTLIMTGVTSCSLKQLFTGAIGPSALLNIQIKLTPLEMVEETEQWIRAGDKVKNSDMVATKTKLVNFSEIKYALLCCYGTKYVDGRVCLQQDNGEKIILALQMKHTTSETYLDPIELTSIITVLEQHYPSYRIVVGAISNRKVSKSKMDEFQKQEKNVFIISKDEVELFAPGLSHRLSYSFDKQFSTPPLHS